MLSRKKSSVFFAFIVIALLACIYGYYNRARDMPPQVVITSPIPVNECDTVPAIDGVVTPSALPDMLPMPHPACPTRLVGGRVEPIAVVFVHATATRLRYYINAEVIDEIGRARFDTVSYHIKVGYDGSIKSLPFDWITAGTGGYNTNSIALALIGGLGEDFQPADTYSDLQKHGGNAEIRRLLRQYPDLKVSLHRVVKNTACPAGVASDSHSWIFEGIDPSRILLTKEAVKQHIASLKKQLQAPLYSHNTTYAQLTP